MASEEVGAVRDNWEGSAVMLTGLKGAAELNGRCGYVEGPRNMETGRWQVNLHAVDNEAQRTISVKDNNILAAPSDKVTALPKPPPGAVSKKRPSALTARPGQFMASYDWREVHMGPPEQSVPQGLEVMLSMNEGVPTLARIPPSWRLEVLVKDAREPFRMMVGKHTTLGEIQAKLQEKHPELEIVPVEGEGWPALTIDKKRLADPSLTVAKARLFGNKVVASPPSSVTLKDSLI